MLSSLRENALNEMKNNFFFVRYKKKKKKESKRSAKRSFEREKKRTHTHSQE